MAKDSLFTADFDNCVTEITDMFTVLRNIHGDLYTDSLRCLFNISNVLAVQQLMMTDMATQFNNPSLPLASIHATGQVVEGLLIDTVQHFAFVVSLDTKKDINIVAESFAADMDMLIAKQREYNPEGAKSV